MRTWTARAALRALVPGEVEGELARFSSLPLVRDAWEHLADSIRRGTSGVEAARGAGLYEVLDHEPGGAG